MFVQSGKIFVDASYVQADASKNSLVDTHSLKKYLGASERLDGLLEKAGEVNGRYISTTDPEASIVRQGMAGPVAGADTRIPDCCGTKYTDTGKACQRQGQGHPNSKTNGHYLPLVRAFAPFFLKKCRFNTSPKVIRKIQNQFLSSRIKSKRL